VAIRIGSRMQIADKVILVYVRQCEAEHAVDHGRIDERTVRRNLDHQVGLHRARRCQVPIQQVGRMPAEALNPDASAEIADTIIARLDGGSDHQLKRHGCRSHALEHAPEQGLIGYRQEHFAREPGRTRPRLYHHHRLHDAALRGAELRAEPGDASTSRQTAAMFRAAQPFWSGSRRRRVARSRYECTCLPSARPTYVTDEY